MGAPLEGIRVLDLSRGVAGPYATKLLADYGADVLKLEPPGGDPLRRFGPFPDDREDLDASGLFLHLNTHKRSARLDPATPEGAAAVRRLARECDIVVEDHEPGRAASWGWGWDELSRDRAELVMVSITSFGQDGPYRDYRGSEITLQAMGGPMISTGHASKEPLKLAGHVAHYAAGAAAALAALLVRYRVEAGATGTTSTSPSTNARRASAIGGRSTSRRRPTRATRTAGARTRGGWRRGCAGRGTATSASTASATGCPASSR